MVITMRLFSLAFLVSFLSLSFTGCSALQQYAKGENGEGGITTEMVVKGLYDALSVGSQRAVGETSREGGFLNNPLIKINMPEELKTVMNTARDIGLGKQVDNLVVQMNRAAEQASGEALDVLITTVKGITFKDAWEILNGNDTAATDYFRVNTTRELTSRFRPIVDTKMKELGVYQVYNVINDAYAKIPFTNSNGFNLEEYVVDQALSGLFKTVATEEAKIRQKLQFRSTPILQKVFGFLEEQRAQGKEAAPTSKATQKSGKSSTTTGGSSMPRGTF